jgi:rare lipoprotein A
MFELVALLLITQQPVQPAMQGPASYYTVASSSNLTASGERFRDDLLTCAMLEGEFGDHFLVVAENGRSVVVRLNDRGPYHRDRVIDLSKAAMRRLGAVNDGVIDVSIFPVSPEEAARIRESK